MENKTETQLLQLKIDIIMVLMEMAVRNDDPKFAKLITKLQKLIK